MIRKSVDVIRAAAEEQRGIADQVVSPAKLRTKFLEVAADLDRAADRLAKLEQIGAILDEYEREHLTPRGLKFEGMILPRIAQLTRG